LLSPDGGEYSDGEIQLCIYKRNLSLKHIFHPTLLYNFDDLQVVAIYNHLIQPHHNNQILLSPDGGEYSDGEIQLCENVCKKANKVIKNNVVNNSFCKLKVLAAGSMVPNTELPKFPSKLPKCPMEKRNAP
jgi:D-serine dehydratase